jgi:enoyl-CoA hydratase
MTLPMAAVEVCRHQLTPAGFQRATILAETFAPGPEAVAVGILDRVVPADDLAAEARATAEQFAALDLAAHAATKLRTRGEALAALHSAIEDELTG